MLAGYESSEQKEEMSLCLYVNMDCMSMHKTCMYYTQGSSSGISKKKLSGHVVPGRVVGAWASGSLIKKLYMFTNKKMDYMQKTCMAR